MAAIATPRVLVSVVENYQNEDGTIRVPEVLQKFMGNMCADKPRATGDQDVLHNIEIT